ncbi:condensation domain-containing protein [Rivihabitans pingtungensis]|uniref:Condensation domain-containing protein n=1 Tax=Rivihabitans pingtungensis TaxID=1054498 RepID=A0A318KU59_9NEIS|nr:condensation domain-containing protein [Rivihabitans pingtungensis]PXX79235.1 condensation domain-containing protein [Rivihabitans pingtungensis]
MKVNKLIHRQLGYMEARMHLMQSMFHGSTQGALAVRLEGELNIQHLHQALQRAVYDFPIMRTVIAECDGQPCFVDGASGALPVTVVAREQDDDWRKVLARLNDQPLDAARQLWRLVVLTPTQVTPGQPPCHDLLLCLHHALMDGTAADTFLHRVLTYCTHPACPPQDARPRSVPPAAETVLPTKMQMTWSEFVGWQREQQAQLPVLPPLPHLATMPLQARRTALATMHVDAGQLARLMDWAARQDVTLNSVLSAALLLAVDAHTPGREQWALYTTFSLRRLCAAQIDEHDVGCCMTVLPTVHRVSGQEVGSLAREHQHALARAVMRQTRVPVSVDVAQLREALMPLRHLTHFVSDLGLTFGESRLQSAYGDLRIRHFYPSVNRSLGNLALAVHGVRLNESLFLTFNHTVPLQSADWVDRVMSRFMDIVSSCPATGG